MDGMPTFANRANLDPNLALFGERNAMFCHLKRRRRSQCRLSAVIFIERELICGSQFIDCQYAHMNDLHGLLPPTAKNSPRLGASPRAEPPLRPKVIKLGD